MQAVAECIQQKRSMPPRINACYACYRMQGRWGNAQALGAAQSALSNGGFPPVR